MAIDWEAVPERFRYLRQAVELCGETRVLPYDPVLKRHISFTERATNEQLDSLASVQSEIVKRDDFTALHNWCKTALHGTESERAASWRIGGILTVLQQLADQDIPPFFSVPCDAEDTAPMVEDEALKLPEDLEYLVGPALHFGEQYHDELRMLRFFEEASDLEQHELAALAERVRMNHDWPRVLQWLNEVGTRHVRYSWEIDNLFHLMDMCDFKFEPE